jgi:rod shape-determining protein MreC
MKKILIIIAFISVVFLILGTPFFISKPGRIIDTFTQIFSLSSIVNQSIQLKKENNDLKNQLFALQSQYSFPSDQRYEYARVFSLYPFNAKNRIYITAGTSQGVSVGEPVMFSKTVLVGQIVSVSSDSSEVITIYDSKFSLPVKIGKAGIDGLLAGGVSPIVGLIDKTKQVNIGDNIYSASKDLSYGLVIGSVKSVKEDSTGTFFNVQIELPYVLSDIIDVYVIKNAYSASHN